MQVFLLKPGILLEMDEETIILQKIGNDHGCGKQTPCRDFYYLLFLYLP